MARSIRAMQISLGQRLQPSETAGVEARVLLAHVLGRPQAWLLAHPETLLSLEQEEQLERYAARLKLGEPLPYLLGQWEFYGLSFHVSPDTLIPRPETELLVETALTWLAAHPGCRQAADVGTGSGCIAVSLAVHTAELHLLATDLSRSALQVAQTNARRHQVAERIDWVQADLLPAAASTLDLICANLPYIPTQTLAGLQVREWEPCLALDGGVDGLEIVRRLLEQIRQVLRPKGCALLEIEATQGQAAGGLAQVAFPEAEVRILPDLAGKDRLLTISSPG